MYVDCRCLTRIKLVVHSEVFGQSIQMHLMHIHRLDAMEEGIFSIIILGLQVEDGRHGEFVLNYYHFHRQSHLCRHMSWPCMFLLHLLQLQVALQL